MTERAKAVQAKYEAELMSKAHVQGVAIGLAKKHGQYTGEIALVVMVDQKVPASTLSPDDIIPSELDGVPVDVQETGMFVAQ
jgi:hypothetical protein